VEEWFVEKIGTTGRFDGGTRWEEEWIGSEIEFPTMGIENTGKDTGFLGRESEDGIFTA
jgi:hypothetical protein